MGCSACFSLNIPWRVAHNREIDYESEVESIRSTVLKMNSKLEDICKKKSDNKAEISNLSLKKFRRMLKKKDGNFQVYQVVFNNLSNQEKTDHAEDQKLKDVWKGTVMYSNVNY